MAFDWPAWLWVQFLFVGSPQKIWRSIFRPTKTSIKESRVRTNTASTVSPLAFLRNLPVDQVTLFWLWSCWGAEFFNHLWRKGYLTPFEAAYTHCMIFELLDVIQGHWAEWLVHVTQAGQMACVNISGMIYVFTVIQLQGGEVKSEVRFCMFLCDRKPQNNGWN